jgi:arylformamidase
VFSFSLRLLRVISIFWIAFSLYSISHSSVFAESRSQIAAAIPAKTLHFDSLNVKSNLLYVRHPRAESLYTTLDIYTPPRIHQQKLPVVVYVHGGWWRSGSKGDVGCKPNWFVDHGFLFASVNYRLSKARPGDSSRFAHNVKHPAHVQDLASALGYLHREVGRYGGDSTAFFLLGHSAGGHLAALVALHGNYLESAGFPREALRGVAVLDPGLLDFPYAWAKGSDTVRARYTNAFNVWSEANVDASPIAQIRIGQKYPPFFLAHVRDYSYRQGRALVERLHQVGGRSVISLIPEKTHMTLDQDLGCPEDGVGKNLAQRMSDWMSSQLDDWQAKPNPAATLSFREDPDSSP